MGAFSIFPHGSIQFIPLGLPLEIKTSRKLKDYKVSPKEVDGMVVFFYALLQILLKSWFIL